MTESPIKASPSDVAPFAFCGLVVRTIPSTDRKASKAILIVKDVVDAIGFSDAAQLSRLLKPEEANLHIVQVEGIIDRIGGRPMTGITFSGLTRILNRLSPREPERQEKVRQFQDWVNDEVLPAIVDTGAYTAAGVQQAQLPVEDGQDLGGAPPASVEPVRIADITVRGFELLERSGYEMTHRDQSLLTRRIRAAGNAARKPRTRSSALSMALPEDDETIPDPPQTALTARQVLHAKTPHWFTTADVARELGHDPARIKGVARAIGRALQGSGVAIWRDRTKTMRIDVEGWTLCVRAARAYYRSAGIHPKRPAARRDGRVGVLVLPKKEMN